MSQDGADKVGKLQAVALIILVAGLAFALICFGISLIKWW